MVDDEQSSDSNRMAALLRSASGGDPAALAEIIRRYEGDICRVVRVRLRSSGLTAVISEEDVTQSVMANFYRAALTGRFDFRTPEQLFSLLAKIAHRQVNKCQEFYRAARRDISRTVGDGELASQPGRELTPSSLVASRELIALIEQHLVEEERKLLSGRVAGRSWGELAQLLGGTPDAVRKRAERAFRRVANVFQAMDY